MHSGTLLPFHRKLCCRNIDRQTLGIGAANCLEMQRISLFSGKSCLSGPICAAHRFVPHIRNCGEDARWPARF